MARPRGSHGRFLPSAKSGGGSSRTKRLVDRDRGYKRIMARALGGKRRAVTVGIQGDEALQVTDDNGTITLAMLAAVHEFGRLDGTIPERSFIRATVDAHEKEYAALIRKLNVLVLSGKLTEERALGMIGAKVASDVKATIEAGIDPELAESTLAGKAQRGLDGPHKPLVETGQLKNAITWDVR